MSALEGAAGDFEDGSALGLILDKRIRAFYPNAGVEERDRIKERIQRKLAVDRLNRVTASAAGAQRRLEQTLAKRPSVVTARPHKSSPKYAKLDAMLRLIAQAQPQGHEEVFEHLDSRKTPLPNSEPFASARGWFRGFRTHPVSARSWLSKRWSNLGLSPFPRGPKKKKLQ